MPILLRRIVSCVEHPRSRNLKKEHTRSEDVTGGEGGEADGGGGRGGGLEEDLLLEIEGLDLVERREHLGFGEEVLVGSSGAERGKG